MISQQEFQTRRNTLAEQLPANSVALIAAAHEVVRNGDAHYRFRQDSNFYYLTGFNEPDALLVILKDETIRSVLFNRPRHPEAEQWTGIRLGQLGALEQLRMDQSFSIEDLSQKLPELLADKTSIYYAFGRSAQLEKLVLDNLKLLKAHVRKGIYPPQFLGDLEPILSEMRLFKSESEIELLREAARISVDAHKKVLRSCKEKHHEYELEAELIYEMTSQGCRNMAYDPIVGSGENACILHYTDNNKPLRSGDLVLIDAGGEYGNYAADITRTFPVNGRFSPEQKSIYKLVLKAQKAGIAAIKPGLAWNKIQQIMVDILTLGLCELGLLKGTVSDLLSQEAYKPFYMHNSGHWLGLDVHDAGRYRVKGEWRPLEEGMVLTVEPGLYIKSNLPEVDARWWGIGVRIEDDVLVTAKGHEVLTSDLPVEVDEIEALMRA